MVGYSQKTIYALRAIFELALRCSEDPVSIAVLAKAQTIPPRFLENILLQLKQAGIVKSVRGKAGGYQLARAAEAITVGDVLRAAEGQLSPISCLTENSQDNCPMHGDCVFLPMWHRAQTAVLSVYDGTTYKDLLAQRERMLQQAYVPNFSI
jgi:Rrf2 family protein